MKRFAKLVAVVLFAVLFVSAIRSVYVARALNGTGIGIINVNCTVHVAGQQCPIVDVENDGDINIKNRGFAQLPSKLGDDRLKLVPTCVAAVNLDPGTPKLCNLFSDKRIPAFNSIFAVGVLSGSQNPRPAEAVPPHLVGMQTKPGESLFAPPSGYGIQDVNGKRYEAMVIYADNDSITLKYTDYDDFRDPGQNGGGYTIHIVGINVDQDLLNKYNDLNDEGRKQLPGVTSTQSIGTAKGNDIMVSIRDTGSFLDPRWQEDWWKGCQGEGKAATVNHQITPYEKELKNIGTGEIRTSQSGGDLGCPLPPGGPYYGGNNNQNKETLGTNFPPIHTLQSCPPEIPVTSEFTKDVPRTGACGVTPKPEPAPCLDPSLVKVGAEKGEWNESDWCGDGPNSSAWCYKDGKGTDGHDYNPDTVFDCSHGRNSSPQQNYGKNIQGYCNGERYAGHGLNNCPFLQFQNACLGLSVSIPATTPDGQPSGCSTNPKDFDSSVDNTILSYCYGYYLFTHPAKPTTEKPVEKTLPACVPTANNSRCVTECSQPVEVNENYKLYIGPIQNCLNTQDCVLKMQLADPQISLPFTKELADYFAGTLDAGAVAAGSLSMEKLKEIQAAMNASGDITTAGSQALVQEGFAKAGVVRKLLPEAIQDQLRCKFINYVKQKITASPHQNTKYYYFENGGMKVFKIDGVPVTSIKIRPNIDQNSCAILSDRTYGQLDWDLDNFGGKVWFNVPLFTDDDAQGMVQFVSPTLYSSNVKNGDPNFPDNPIGPVYISVPDIQRLENSIDVLQKALVPQSLIASQQEQIATKAFPEPIGKTLQIIKATERYAAGLDINACRPIPEGTDSWKPYYNPNLIKQYENAQTIESEYDRGVLCKVPLPSDKGTDSSKICVVGPSGQMFCYREDTPDNPLQLRTGKPVQDKQVLQVRTVIPYLFDLAENAISPAAGLLRIFTPKSAPLEQQKKFEQAFDPIPAASDPVKYQLTGAYATIDENSDGAKNGWKIFFYKLGGVWNARNFVLELLNPQKK